MITVGIKRDGTTNWYRAHSLNRRPDGQMVAFCLDDQRTAYIIPARMFAGVFGNETDYNGRDYPDLSPEVKL